MTHIEAALEAAWLAGERLASLFETGLPAETKSSDIDLVTAADRAAETLIVEHLRRAYPDIGVLAEEGGEVGHSTPLRWLVDPLDGTTNFAHGFPHFSVSIALFDDGPDDGRLLVGVVHDPLRNETFFAERGKGAWLVSPRHPEPGRRLRVTGVDALKRSILATGFGYDRATAERNNVDEFVRLIPRVRGIRRAGSAALDLAYVAAGRLDGYWEFGLSPWDWAAGALLVREAGGIVTTLDGDPWTPGRDSMVAAGPKLHGVAKRALRP